MYDRTKARYFSIMLSGNMRLYIGYAIAFSFVYTMPIFPGLLLQKFFNSIQREDASVSRPTYDSLCRSGVT